MLKIVVLLISLTHFCFANEYNIIHWNTVSFPPSLIPEGKLKNQGYSDIVREILINNMSEYKHNVELGNSKLAITNLKRLEYACFSGLNFNEKRKEFIYFSQPVIFSLPNELIINKSNEKKFEKYLTANNEIDLLQLLKKDEFILGYVDSRAYNIYIDELIQKYKSNKKIFGRKGKDLTKGLLQMLALNRVDYILEYPSMVTYNKDKFNIASEFVNYQIKNSNDLIKVYIGCSKSKYGKALITRINKIIVNEKSNFSNAYKNWIPKDSIKRYETALHNKINE